MQEERGAVYGAVLTVGREGDLASGRRASDEYASTADILFSAALACRLGPETPRSSAVSPSQLTGNCLYLGPRRWRTRRRWQHVLS